MPRKAAKGSDTSGRAAAMAVAHAHNVTAKNIIDEYLAEKTCMLLELVEVAVCGSAVCGCARSSAHVEKIK